MTALLSMACAPECGKASLLTARAETTPCFLSCVQIAQASVRKVVQLCREISEDAQTPARKPTEEAAACDEHSAEAGAVRRDRVRRAQMSARRETQLSK